MNYRFYGYFVLAMALGLLVGESEAERQRDKSYVFGGEIASPIPINGDRDEAATQRSASCHSPPKGVPEGKPRTVAPRRYELGAGRKRQVWLNTYDKSRQLPDVVGVTHVDGKYHLTNKDFLNEGADQILALGSRVIKVWFHNPGKSYPFNSQWPAMESMVDTARSPYFRELFDKPFTTYILMCFSKGRGAGYFRNGITAEQAQDEQRQFYELAKYLLTTYQHTGKTFVLQHWEGDWLIRGSYDGNADPTPKAIKGMIGWLNSRQAGVNQALKEVGTNGIRVYHATEVNRVVRSMRDGRPNMVNKVLPHTKLDLVSYSAWDATSEHVRDPNVFREALDYIAANMPDSTDFGDRNVYVGEFGIPQNEFPAERARELIPDVVKTARDWGCPYIVYWQLYCNELKPRVRATPVTENNAVRGFWLIRPDGTKTQTWDYFHQLLSPN